MSLEQELARNTAALEALTAALKAHGNTPVAEPTKKPKSDASTQPATEPSVVVAQVETVAESPSKVLKYEDVQRPFLALVNSNRDAALAVLAKHEAKTLKVFENKPELYATLLAEIKEAANG